MATAAPDRDRARQQPDIATALVTLLAAAVAITGAIVALANPDVLSVHDYLEAMATCTVGAGLLGIGRGIYAASRRAYPYITPGTVRAPVGPRDPMVP